jgi:hypothetical protein
MNKSNDTKKSCSNLERKYRNVRAALNIGRRRENEIRARNKIRARNYRKELKGSMRRKEQNRGFELGEHKTRKSHFVYEVQKSKSVVIQASQGLRQVTKDVCYSCSQTGGAGAEPQTGVGLVKVVGAKVGRVGRKRIPHQKGQHKGQVNIEGNQGILGQSATSLLGLVHSVLE